VVKWRQLQNTQNMPPFDHTQMEAIFNTQNMPPFDHTQMEAIFSTQNNVSNAAI
jgi:hypothetical protein